MRRSQITVSFFLFFSSSVAEAQTSSICDVIIKNPTFTSSIISTSASAKESMRKLLCSANWKSASDAQRAGISATIPIYDLQIPIEANWSQNKIDQWKSQNCSAEDINKEYGSVLFQSNYSVDPANAQATLSCLTSLLDRRALRCAVTENSSAVIFEAEWRKTAGEAGSGPTVESFVVSNTNCINSEVLGKNKIVPDGGVSVLCSVTDQAPVFSLNTNRGQCFAAGSSKEDVLGLAGPIVLDKATTFRAKRIKISPDTRIITNGNQLRIQADRLDISGSPQIISFVPSSTIPMKPGRNAAPIFIYAQSISGGGLSILNAGEPGGDGTIGPQGAPGAPGAPGKGRTTNWKKNCPIPLVCDVIPTGCEGGDNGGQGGQGSVGYPGNPGMPGGAAGEITLALPSSDENSVLVLTDTKLDGSTMNCNGMICGGAGGQGGAGGPGGSGGPGGPGAPGTVYCGGTNAGGTGPQGPQGPQGSPGSAGAHASVKRT